MSTSARLWVTLLSSLAGGTGCQWFAVTYSALNYPESGRGQSANVTVVETTAYGTLGEDGLEVVNLAEPQPRSVLTPPKGSESIDDIAVADGFLFALDAREPGHLMVFRISDPAGSPELTSGPVEVMVGPFSGVSAGNGRVIVSGGTSSLTLFQYDEMGRLGPNPAGIDLGRGQPDVLISPDGRSAFVSTHYIGPYFGLITVGISGDPAEVKKSGNLDLDTYGFTEGGAKPANFPIEAALAGSTLLVAHAPGLAVIAVDTLDHPRLVTLVDVGIKAVNVDVFGTTAAVVGSWPKPLLVLLDVSNPMTPVITQTVPLPEGTYATSVSVGPEHVVVAGHEKGLLIFQHHNWSVTTGKESL